MVSTRILISPRIIKWGGYFKTKYGWNQDGGVGRHTAPPRTTRTDRESNSKGDQHQGNRK